MPPLRLLLLGGTTEASALARALAGRPGLEVVTSLAGRTTNPLPRPGAVRVGGFGGADGLAAYLRHAAVDLVVDATHPFAAVMRWHAAEACARTGVPRLRVERPPWSAHPDNHWMAARSLADAGRAVAASSARRVFLTVGRGELAAFEVAADGSRWWLVRCIEVPERLALHPSEVVLARGPFSLAGELELMAAHRIDLLVAKNSGGAAAAAKLEAARSLGVTVLMVARPPSPPGPLVATVDEAVAWVEAEGRLVQDPGGGAG